MPLAKSLPDVPRMEDPGVYELLRAMRMLVLSMATELQSVAATSSAMATREIVTFGRDTTEYVTFNRTTEKFEFYQEGVLVYSIPP